MVQIKKSPFSPSVWYVWPMVLKLSQTVKLTVGFQRLVDLPSVGPISDRLCSTNLIVMIYVTL
jgi:hypothetical protein